MKSSSSAELVRKRLIHEELDWSEGKTPYVGMGGTLGGFGIDRSPVTVMKVSDDGKTVWVASDDYISVGPPPCESESQQYEYYESPTSGNEKFWGCYTLRKNGKWVRLHEDLNKGSKLWLGFRERWYNPSF